MTRRTVPLASHCRRICAIRCRVTPVLRIKSEVRQNDRRSASRRSRVGWRAFVLALFELSPAGWAPADARARLPLMIDRPPEIFWGECGSRSNGVARAGSWRLGAALRDGNGGAAAPLTTH